MTEIWLSFDVFSVSESTLIDLAFCKRIIEVVIIVKKKGEKSKQERKKTALPYHIPEKSIKYRTVYHYLT